jgi:hypothetical protein
LDGMLFIDRIENLDDLYYVRIDDTDKPLRVPIL